MDAWRDLWEITPIPHRHRFGQGDRYDNYEGVVGEIDSLHVPSSVLQEANINNRKTSVEMLALGKPGGSIFGASHWMYEAERDRFGSILSLTPENFRRIKWLEA